MCWTTWIFQASHLVEHSGFHNALAICDITSNWKQKYSHRTMEVVTQDCIFLLSFFNFQESRGFLFHFISPFSDGAPPGSRMKNRRIDNSTIKYHTNLFLGFSSVIYDHFSMP